MKSQGTFRLHRGRMLGITSPSCGFPYQKYRPQGHHRGDPAHVLPAKFNTVLDAHPATAADKVANKGHLVSLRFGPMWPARRVFDYIACEHQEVKTYCTFLSGSKSAI